MLLFPIDLEKGSQPRLELGFPLFNQPAIRRLSGAERDAFLEELVQLEEELGLTTSDELPDLDELVLRLAALRSEWSWKEQIAPERLNNDPPLAGATEPGIYNRAVLVVAERSPFTQGLEAELKELSRVPPHVLESSILGQLFGDKVAGASSRSHKLIEVLPLNSEQRVAIEQSLTAPLTIITGPPGTGKSQVVTNLLINSAWHGKRVIFASKNNKAVDVVESRVNNLGPRPILLRVGSNQYQTKLAEYLVGLLAATASSEDKAEFAEAQSIQDCLYEQLNGLDRNEQRVVELRNTVDEYERGAEAARTILDAPALEALRRLDLHALTQADEHLQRCLDAADRRRQPLFSRLFWKFTRERCFHDLHQAGLGLASSGVGLGISFPNLPPSDHTLAGWQHAAEVSRQRLAAASSAKRYFDSLSELQKVVPLEEIAKRRASLIAQLAENAEQLWKSWLRLQPTTLSQSDRRLLQRYNALLRIVIDTGADGKLPPDVYKQYRKLFSEVAHLLPCWAVTSLSAKGKVPFEAGHFDMVIFDEASQCDIASALPLLFRAKRAVIIGDPKQLTHISGMPRGQDVKLLQRFGLADRAHWAYSYNSLFDLGAGLANQDDIVNLRDHHRCHADIIGFSNQMFYEGRLRVATRYALLKRPARATAGVRWIDVKGSVTRPAGSSALNRSEAKSVVKALRDLLLNQGYIGSIGVVTPFGAQANIIRELANEDAELSEKLPMHDFLVDTVHKFQGDERDLMIFSPVISEGAAPGTISFLKNNGNLFNVAITRARAQLLVIGDRSAAAECEVDYLRRFASYASQVEQTSKHEAATDIAKLGADYPPVSSPDRVSDWERILYKAMYAAGIRSLPQYSVENYALDFAFFDGDRKLNIEVDGERYHRNWDGELCRRDQIRNQRLIELGWDVMRFWVYEVRDDMNGCLRRIGDWIAKNRETAN